jgi:HEAT repeat protein
MSTTPEQMNMRNVQKKLVFVAALAAAGLVLGALGGPAQAGRGGSPQLIQQAIAANSVDAIQAELERAEYLVCAGCVDLVMPLVDHADYRVRKVAAWWLSRRATSRQVYVSMLNRLSQPDSTAARNAADVLGEMGYPSAIPALGAAMSNPIFSGDARAAMARALAAIGRPEAATPLMTGLGDASPQVRAASVAALREVTGVHSAPFAVPLVSDADEQVRVQSIITIGVKREQTAAVALVQALASDPSVAVRKNAAWALGQIGASASVAGPNLQLAATSDPNPFVRSLAQAAISHLGP